MTQTDIHPDRPAMRDRAKALIAGFDALPAPQTLSDMLRTARLLMALDRLLTQLWKTPAEKTAGKTPQDTPLPARKAEEAPQPLNRQQRRALDAQNKAARVKEVRADRLSVAPTIAHYATG
ncbi:MAG: hypothetical protein QM647_00840 [Asticcacaulis sp.]|uniref:hypothetical protein n=1 Tax=Asticcacaulis sp. TaxID=1872648 RepID=UPI0039E5EBE8